MGHTASGWRSLWGWVCLLWLVTFAGVFMIRSIGSGHHAIMALMLPAGVGCGSCWWVHKDVWSLRRHLWRILVGSPMLSLGCNWIVVFSATSYREHLRVWGLLIGVAAYATGWWIVYSGHTKGSRVMSGAVRRSS
jgi:hypothetical protein